MSDFIQLEEAQPYLSFLEMVSTGKKDNGIWLFPEVLWKRKASIFEKEESTWTHTISV
jgi:hypothetical protein